MPSLARARVPFLLGAALALVSCEAILGIHDVEQDPGVGGATSSSSRASSTSTSSSTSSSSSTGAGGIGNPPTSPELRTPLNNAYVGGVHAAGSMRPKFAWTKATGTGSVTYVVEIDKDATFPAPTKSPAVTTTSWQPATDLAVSMVQPVGDRLYWRVKACIGSACALSTTTRWVNVGRPLGDVNGDGFDDFLVGYPNDPGPAMHVRLGSVRVFDGGAGTTFPGMQTQIVYGPLAMEGYEMGHSEITADVNGDGYADVIAGGAGLNGKGLLYVFFGSATGIKDAPDLTIARPVDNLPYSGFGTPLANAGDVNGDGYQDIIAGAPLSADGLIAGAAFVFLGGPTFDGKRYVALNGLTTNDLYGQSVAGAGDLDGDGFDDVLVGVPNEGTGIVRVYRGTSSGLESKPSDSLAVAGATGIGNVVASAGDFNGDGNADLVVTSSTSDAYVFFGAGKGFISKTPDWTVHEAGANGAVATLLDADEDGYADLALGVPMDGNIGHVRIYTGSAHPDTTADGKLARIGASGALGIALATGDFNGDGRMDLVSPRDQGDPRLEFFISQGTSYPAANIAPSTEVSIPNCVSFY